MTYREWRVLLLSSWLEPEMGRLVFVVLYVPVFGLVLGWLTSQLPQRALQGRWYS